MHPLHDYVAKQLADKLKDRRIVVWYDERSEFRPFVDEVRGGPRAAAEPIAVGIADAPVRPEPRTTDGLCGSVRLDGFVEPVGLR